MPLANPTPDRIFVYVRSAEVVAFIGTSGPVLPDDTMRQLIGRYYSQGATDLLLYSFDSTISGAGFFSAAAIAHLQAFVALCVPWGIKVHIPIQIRNNSVNAIWSYNTINAPTPAEKIGWISEYEWWNLGYYAFVQARDVTSFWQANLIASGTEYGPYTGFTKTNNASYNENFPVTSMVAVGATVTVTVDTSADPNYTFVSGGSCFLSGVTGFANNPNGQFVMSAATTNSFQISHVAGAGAYGGAASVSSVYTGPGEITELESLFTNWYIHDYVLIPRYSYMQSRLLQFSVPVNVAPICSMESTTAVPAQANNFSGNFRMGQDPAGTLTYSTKSWVQVYQYIMIDTQAMGLLPNQVGSPQYANAETDAGILANVTYIGIVIFTGTYEYNLGGTGRAVTDGSRIMVYAGADQAFGSTAGTITIGDCFAYDDWVPVGGTPTYTWSVASAPPGATIQTFSNGFGFLTSGTAPITNFTFSAPSLGNWVLLLAVSDGITTTLDEFQLIIRGASGGMTLSVVEFKGTTCAGDCDGQAEATVTSGGVAPFTYVWSNGFTDGPTASTTSTTLADVCAGLITCTVTDSTGGTPLTATQSATITSDPPLVISLTPTNPLCAGDSDGQIVMVVTGGDPLGIALITWTKNTIPFIPADDYNPINLGLGLYEVTVTDNGGCVKTAQVNIIEPVAMSASPMIQSPTCFGFTNGTIAATISNGTPGYTYQWYDPLLVVVPLATSNNISNVYAGAWTLQVTDSNACVQEFIFTVVDPDPIVVTVIPIGSPNLCVGQELVFLATVDSGGTAPYTYAWTPTNDISPTTGDFTVFAPSAPGPYTYTCTVTDANGCVGFASVSGVVSPSFTIVPIISKSGDLGSCPGDQITLTIDNFASFGAVLWTNTGETTQSIIVGYADTFAVLGYSPLLDGCTSQGDIVITQTPTTIQLIGITNNVCGGSLTAGVINVNTFGGCPAYTWVWTDAQGTTVGTSENLSGVPSGTYTVVATDSLGQTATANFTISTTSPVVEITFTNMPDAVATANVTGGSAPYTYVWTDPNGDNFSGDTISGLNVAGMYRVLVTDANGCTDTDIVCISPMYSFGMSECDFKCFLQQMSCCQADMVYKMIEADKGGKDTCVEKTELMESYLELLQCYYPEGAVINAGKLAYYALTINSYTNGGTLVITLLQNVIVNYTFDTGLTFEQNLDNIVALVVAAGQTANYITDGSSYANLFINAPAVGAGWNCVTMDIVVTGANIETLTTNGFTGGADEVVADPPCLTDDEINHIIEQMKCICDCGECINLTTLTNDNLIY